MNDKGYYLQKDKKTNETIYIEYKNIDGYKITPKTKKEDAIEVNKIVFVSPTMSEKLVRKKIEKKITYLLNKLKEIDDAGDDAGSDAIRQSLMDAERLKIMIINNYVRYLGHTYQSLTLRKIQIIINQLRVKLYMLRDRSLENTEYIEKGRGR